MPSPPFPASDGTRHIGHCGCGSQGLLRPGSRFSHRAALHVVIGDLIPPAGAGWHAALALRDQARAAVLALSGEPGTGGPGHTHAAVSTPAASTSPR